MKYSVNLSGKWADVAPFFESYPDAMEQVCARVGKADIHVESMTVKDLCEILDGRTPGCITRQAERWTVKEMAEAVNGLRASLEGFRNFMERTTPPVTMSQRGMLAGVLEASAEEAVLLTCKEFYTLHGLEDAQNLSVYEYMIARKAIYNERRQAYNMEMSASRHRGGRGAAAGGM